MALIGLVVAGIGLATQAVGASKVASGQKRKARTEGEIRDLQNAQNRRDTIRGARDALGSQQAAAFATGAGFSSGQQGGEDSLISQLAFNLSLYDQYDTLQKIIDSSNLKISKGATIGAIGGAITSIGVGGDFSSLSNLGKSVGTTAPSAIAPPSTIVATPLPPGARNA